MRQEPELTIDEPFELSSSDLELAEEDALPIELLPSRRTVPPVSALNYTVAGPRGNELVDPAWCEEQTVVMSADQLNQILEQERLTQELVKNLHTRPTVRSMQAVVPPSRPCPEVTVVDSQGRRLEPDQWNT